MPTDFSLPWLPGDMLDYYLSQGYYRMRQDLFTCRFLPRPDQLNTVHWLRVVLDQVRYGPRQRHLLRRNADFTMTVCPFALTDEYKALYARYYQTLDFDTAPTLEGLLLDETGHNVFDSRVVEVRDAGRLVAAGVFDQGHRALAGIVNFYDPDYRRHSLGKYLLLQKTSYAQQQGLTYYYPGYLVHGDPKFDYKLFVDEAATEVYDALASEWRPFSWEEVNRQSAAVLASWLLENADE